MSDLFLSQSRKEIAESFAQLAKTYLHLLSPVEELLSTLEPNTALALQYLYTTMPLSDMANYTPNLFLDFAAHGVRLWQELPGVRALPEEIYLEYVLQSRVNAEELRPCRPLFYSELYPDVAEDSPLQAVLRINFWCASHVTYQASDGRTLSALATYNCGHGRCGEESVFAVNVFRSVGIPARQVYVPRWGHCDDNHAWVEVWVDDQWYFLGACEPEPVLNRGWFNAAASRAMMVHARSFLPFRPHREEVGQEGMVSLSSQLFRYARVSPITVAVKTPDGSPIPGARVEFCLLNMAEFFPIATRYTGEDGLATLETGKGSLWIQVHTPEGGFFTGHLDSRRDSTLTILCDHSLSAEEYGWSPLDLAAPQELPLPGTLDFAYTPQQEEEKSRMIALADIKRSMWTHRSSNSKADLFPVNSDHLHLFHALLSTLSEKDMIDCNTRVLDQHLSCARLYESTLPDHLFVPYVLAPRVDTEIIRPYRHRILQTFRQQAEDFRQNPRLLWSWIQTHIQEQPQREHTSLITTPESCLSFGYGSRHSKNILFVTACRTLGIPARLHPRDRAPEFWDGTDFVPAEESIHRSATLCLSSGDPTVVWSYGQNWSLGRWEGQGYTTLNLEDDLWKDGRLSLSLCPGQYRLITTRRLPAGDQLVYHRQFVLSSHQSREESLHLRPVRWQDLLVDIPLPDFTLTTRDKKSLPASALVKGGSHVLLWPEASKEPTEHILDELLSLKQTLLPYQHRILLVLQNEASLQDGKIQQVLQQLPGIRVFFGHGSSDVTGLARRVYVDPDKLPLVMMVRPNLHAIYGVSGYQVGTGAMLAQLFAAEDL